MTFIKLPFSFKHSVLAAGSETNTTFALLKKDEVFISRPYRDLKDPSVLNDFKSDIIKAEKKLHIKPDVAACDLHPAYVSSEYIRGIGSRYLIEIQHHHAHVASCMAENSLKGRVIGVAFDGTGYGEDAAVWGGEFLVAGYDSYKRAAHIAYAAMPGGDKAVSSPIRMAFSELYKAYGGGIMRVKTGVLKRLGKDKIRIFKNMIDKKINSPLTSSAGRLFDAVSSLLGVKDRILYEGEAAIALEAMARTSGCGSSYGFRLKTKDGVINIEFGQMIKGIIRDLARKEGAADIARKFHNTLSEAIEKVCRTLRRRYNQNRVVLTGGVFQNKILSSLARERLLSSGFLVYTHRDLSASDRGISLGQAVIAASKTEKKRCA